MKKDRHLEQKSILPPSSQRIRKVANEEAEDGYCYVGPQFYKNYQLCILLLGDAISERVLYAF